MTQIRTIDPMTSSVKIWDPLVRIFHWSLVLSIALAWLSADSSHKWHDYFGYAAAGLIGFRLIWGLVGSKYARFSQFIRSPKHTLDYIAELAQHREKRYLGHNPLGALMVAALLLAIGGTAFSGWLTTNDAYRGIEWVEDAHEALANLLLALIGLHVLGVIFSSFRHGENLVRAMVTGKKPAPQAEDVL